MQVEISKCITAVEQRIKGKTEQVELALICLFAEGHLLLEDLPGMGKTTLSQCLASVLNLEFARIQFTSDLLPADMLGVNIYEADNHRFSFHPGPIFSQMVLADEINRASPKTQSALLEAMAEQQVTVDGKSYPLPTPFFVIATQNPLHQSGTNPLPESQIDRFMMKLSIGYPDFDAEKAMLKMSKVHSYPEAVLSHEQLKDIQERVKDVKVSDAVIQYILNLVNFTRQSNEFPNPLSPRASKAIYSAAQATAFVQGRDFVIPEDVQFILPAVTEHRLLGQDSISKQNIRLSDLLLKQVDPLAA